MSTAETVVAAEPGSHAVTITRTFDAPRELVFRAWTDPDLLVRWLGPRRLRMTIGHWEPVDGGRWDFTHVDPADPDTVHTFRGLFHGTPTVEDGLLWTFEYQPWPGHVSLERVTFTEEDGRTTMHTVAVHLSVADRDAMIDAGMERGLREGYGQLDELLAALRAGV